VNFGECLETSLKARGGSQMDGNRNPGMRRSAIWEGGLPVERRLTTEAKRPRHEMSPVVAIAAVGRGKWFL
jgi:hypothetical protein